MDCRHLYIIQKPRSKVKSWQKYGFVCKYLAVWHTIPILFLYMLSLLHVLYCIYFYCTSSKLVCISTFGYLFSTSVNMNVHVFIFLIPTSVTFFCSASSKNLHTTAKSNGMAHYSDCDWCPCTGGCHSNHHHHHCGFLPSNQ